MYVNLENQDLPRFSFNSGHRKSTTATNWGKFGKLHLQIDPKVGNIRPTWLEHSKIGLTYNIDFWKKCTNVFRTFFFFNFGSEVQISEFNDKFFADLSFFESWSRQCTFKSLHSSHTPILFCKMAIAFALENVETLRETPF